MRYLASRWFAFFKMAFNSLMFALVEFCWKLLLVGLITANKTHLYWKLWSWKRKPKLVLFTLWFWYWEIEGNAFEMQCTRISLYFQAFLWEFLLELLTSFDGAFAPFTTKFLFQEKLWPLNISLVMSNLIKCGPSMIWNSKFECLFFGENWKSLSLKTLFCPKKVF